MFDVISVTGVVFVLIGVGFASVRSGMFGEKEFGILTRYMLNIALPALVVNAISSRHFSEIVDVAYLGAYLFGSLVAFAVGYVLSRRVLKRDGTASAFDAMGFSASNSGFIGFPTLNIIMPAVAPIALALDMLVENFVMLPLELMLAERGQSRGMRGMALAKQIITRLAKNPIMIGIALGCAISLSGVDLPQLIARPIALMAASATAPALIIIGGNLASLPSGSANGSIGFIVVGKLILHPLAVFAGLILMGKAGFTPASDELFNAAIIMAAVPQMGLYTMLAHQYGESKTASFATFLTTLASFFTLTWLIWYLDVIPSTL